MFEMSLGDGSLRCVCNWLFENWQSMSFHAGESEDESEVTSADRRSKSEAKGGLGDVLTDAALHRAFAMFFSFLYHFFELDGLVSLWH